MRSLLSIVFTLFTCALFGQNGYVKLNNDSILVGYLRYYTSPKDGQRGIEFWRTKKDKEPVKISKQKIREYAIKKDTFAILRDFYPFEGDAYHVESVEAKVLIGYGKVKLYYAALPGYKDEIDRMFTPSTPGQLYRTIYSTYIAWHPDYNFVGIDKEKEKFLNAMEIIIGDNPELIKRVGKELWYDDTKEIIRIYNKG